MAKYPTRVEGWLGMWEKNMLPWHTEYVHEALEQHHEILAMSPTAKNKIFIPLCGKTVDIKWLADKGNEVVGVEASELAAKQFFTEQNIEFTTEEVPAVKGMLYKSRDNKIKLYCCDLFSFSAEVESGFSGVWDRGSFVALTPEYHDKYIELMKTLSHPGIGYLLEMPDLDPSMGPPYCLPVDVLGARFGCSVARLLEVTKSPPALLARPGLKAIYVYQLTFQ